jgi:1-acyl-sn-glycerol-3-phosphate acyltransferase
LLYFLLKIYARLIIGIFCREIRISNKSFLNATGPLILAANHPNSFLDAVIIDTLFDKPVYSLARGDAFSKMWIARILKALKILPVYRQKEGKENLHRNYNTFDACQHIFKSKGIVLIFTEALCENEWHLRPLKKGTARLAAAAWDQGIPLKILPVGLNYSSFRLFGKNVHLNIGTPITREQLKTTTNENGKLLNEITDNIEMQLRQLVYEINKSDKQKQAETFEIQVPVLRKMLLYIPAGVGCVTHCVLYWPLQKLLWKKISPTGHFDAVITAILFFIYPFYLLLFVLVAIYFIGAWGWFVFAVFPFFAWSYVQLKKQTDK